MGGNFFRAIPDSDRIGAKVTDIGLTVHVATKLNRSHLTPGKRAYILPALGRTEKDMQAGGQQSVTVEDSFAMVHASTGALRPASEECRSEPWIVAKLAKATAGAGASIDWDGMVADYDRIRDKIEAVIPGFADYNERIQEPGGFHLPIAARERRWETPTGKANYLFVHGMMDEDDDAPENPHLQLMTIRSHDQFNTTVYSYNDRYRGVSGERMVVFMNEQDMHELAVAEGSIIEFTTVSEDGIDRRVSGFKVVAYDVPPGCCAAYYPETNALLPLAHRDERSNTPAAKSVPVRITAARPGTPASAEREVAETYPDRMPMVPPAIA
jgi:molybdopterin-dependent oxidoreductase alpha subunit